MVWRGEFPKVWVVCVDEYVVVVQTATPVLISNEGKTRFESDAIARSCSSRLRLVCNTSERSGRMEGDAGTYFLLARNSCTPTIVKCLMYSCTQPRVYRFQVYLYAKCRCRPPGRLADVDLAAPADVARILCSLRSCSTCSSRLHSRGTGISQLRLR